MRETRTTVQITANQIDMDIYRLAARIDDLCEMASRGKPAMRDDLVSAASRVASARSAVRNLMHKSDREGTEG